MNMNDAFKEMFGAIKAGEGLKGQTKEFLLKKTNGYTENRAERHAYRICAAVCCFLLTLLGGCWFYLTPAAQISIDINPSIEMDVNRFDQVTSVSVFNEDGQELADVLDLKYKKYTEAIRQIVSQDAVVTLLSNNEVMTITVVGPDQEKSAKMLSEVSKCTEGQSNTYCYSASTQEVAPAHAMGLSCGKYRAYLELQLLDPGITPEAVKGMTMREIRDLLSSLATGGGDEAPAIEDDARGHGHGHCNGKR